MEEADDARPCFDRRPDARVPRRPRRALGTGRGAGRDPRRGVRAQGRDGPDLRRPPAAGPGQRSRRPLHGERWMVFPVEPAGAHRSALLRAARPGLHRLRGPPRQRSPVQGAGRPRRRGPGRPLRPPPRSRPRSGSRTSRGLRRKRRGAPVADARAPHRRGPRRRGRRGDGRVRPGLRRGRLLSARGPPAARRPQRALPRPGVQRRARPFDLSRPLRVGGRPADAPGPRRRGRAGADPEQRDDAGSAPGSGGRIGVHHHPRRGSRLQRRPESSAGGPGHGGVVRRASDRRLGGVADGFCMPAPRRPEPPQSPSVPRPSGERR